MRSERHEYVPRKLTIAALALAASLGTAPAFTAQAADANAVAAQTAQPAGVDKRLHAGLIKRLTEALSHPAVLMTLESRNKAAGDVSQDEIDALDKQWRAETKSEDQPLITAVLTGPLSGYLLQMQAGSLGLYSEIFVMDANGLNAGQSAITSDYWQGDEGKFQKTYDVGAGAIFIDDAEFHEGTGTWRQQVNMSITNDQGELTGAATIEINLDELARRRSLGII